MLSRELVPFVLRVVMQPLLFLFVFTYVLPAHAEHQPNPIAARARGRTSRTVLLPGLMAVAIMFCGIAAVALPLASEFGVTREIDDRVMCPLPVAAVAIEKVCFSAMQSILAAAAHHSRWPTWSPRTPVHAHVSNWPLLIAVLVLASLTAGALGLTIGTTSSPSRSGWSSAIVVMPITFLGCVYYPWAFLNHVRWLQILVLVNPIVYMSEGLRAALTPSVPHMPAPLILVALLISLALLWRLGLKGFLRRVIS